MKTVYPILLVLIFAISGCKEIQPIIQPINTLSKRKVLIEEFTGVGCVGCPAGSAQIEALLGLYPDNLVAVSIHEGNFARKRNWNSNQKYDFQTERGGQLVNDYFGGEPFAYPSATVDREKTSTNTYFIGKDEWAGRIAEELSEELLVKLDLNHSYNESLREIDFEIEITALEELGKDLRVSAYITESNIVDYQKVQEEREWDPEYVHKHVLRTIITDVDGEQISQEDLTSGKSVLKKLSFELPEEWDENNCSLVVFVHRNTPDSREVLNAEEVHIVE